MSNLAVSPTLIQERIIHNTNEFLCSKNERVLVEHLTSLKRKDQDFSFDTYFKGIKESNWEDIRNQFPVLNETFLSQKSKIEALFDDIIDSFHEDKSLLKEKEIINESSLQDINIGEGDQHNGKSTAILKLSNNQKVVFKPTNGAVSEVYFGFLDWINEHYELGDYRYKIFNKGTYHWQEFVNDKECNTSENIEIYYKRAGFLLCVLYVLNGMDFHSENIIAHGNTPVLIDHETVIQPKVRTTGDFNEAFVQFNSNKLDSVFGSFLLPNNEVKGLFPVGMCGLGYSKQTFSQGYKRVGVNRYTKDWKIVKKLVKQNYVERNVPKLNNEEVFVENYLNEFIEGFDQCYKLLLEKRSFLLHQKNSPIKEMENVPVRYVWRATNVYAKILEYMNLPKNLKDRNLYEQKIREYLAIAFKRVPKNSQYLRILDHEVAQMLRGDIPYFEVNSSSRDLETEFGSVKDFFELSCVENINRKLNKLSVQDLELQKQLIKESILG